MEIVEFYDNITNVIHEKNKYINFGKLLQWKRIDKKREINEGKFEIKHTSERCKMLVNLSESYKIMIMSAY